MRTHHSRPLIKAVIVFILLFFCLDLLIASAQTTVVRPPTRRPRGSGTVPNVPPPPSNVQAGGQIGSTSQGLTTCEPSPINDAGTIAVRAFTGGYRVLGLAAPRGGDILDSRGDLISFWVVPDGNDWIRMSASDLRPIVDAGADLNELVFIGAVALGNNRYDWKAVGSCANFYNRDAGGDQFLVDLYYSYNNDPATSPDRPAPNFEIATSLNIEVLPLQIPEILIQPDAIVSVAQVGFSEEGTVALGTVNNSLTGNEGDIYRFYAAAGTIINVRVSSGIDTVAEIRDANGSTLAFDDDSGGDYNPLLRYTLPADGNYALLIRPYSAGNTGAYSVTTTLEEPSIPAASAPSTLTSGSYSDFIDSDAGDRFSFSASAGTFIYVAVTSDLDTVAEIYGSSGDQLAYNDDSNNTYNPYIAYELPYTGSYVLVIRPYSSGVRGPYQFAVTFEGGTAAAGCPGLPPPQLYVGATVVVTPGNATRVRADTSTSSAILTQMRRNTPAQVLAGPVCADGRTWWQVSYNGITGWAAEVDSDGEYLLMVR